MPLLALPGELVEQRGRVGVGPGGAHEDAVERRDPLVHLRGEADEPCELLAGVRPLDQRPDVGALGHGDGVVVTRDRHVEEGLEDAVLRREQPVHGRRRHLRALADGLDRGRSVAPLEEQGPSGVDDGGPGESRSGLSRHELRLALLN